MEGIYDKFESVLIWGAVFFTIGLVIYLAYLQYLGVKRRRSHRSHRAHRSMRRSSGTPAERRPSHNPQS